MSGSQSSRGVQVLDSRGRMQQRDVIEGDRPPDDLFKSHPVLACDLAAQVEQVVLAEPARERLGYLGREHLPQSADSEVVPVGGDLALVVASSDPTIAASSDGGSSAGEWSASPGRERGLVMRPFSPFSASMPTLGDPGPCAGGGRPVGAVCHDGRVEATAGHDQRIPVTARAAWAIPCAVAVGLGVASVAQLATGREAAWYVVWPILAAVVAAACVVAAGRTFRSLVLAVLPWSLLAALGPVGGSARWLMLPVVLVAGGVSGRTLERYRYF